ncbi:MAG: DegT/DnrJ/EryC1/StrS family aminotransferase [Verrucomicrobiae bacterium]|nr:DegT/DnrJ/EryC1/StrS family aminotransferase [Verrucomicrobiae bacterium]
MKINWPHEFPGVYWQDKKEEQAVLDVLRNGSLFRYYGLRPPKHVDRYEKAACAFYQVKHALAVNSGTGALMASMRAFGIGPGCEVIVPAFLWVATVGAVVQMDAIPVLCEVDDTFTMDPWDLQRKITPRTKLIVPIHMAGAPCNMTAIMKIARQHGIPVLEDCAQCNGGSYRGQKVGTFGDMGIFSLQLNKNMTCGEGGLVITNNTHLYTRAFAAHDMGLIRVNGRLSMPEPSSLLWGGGRRMSELCGAVAGVQLRKLPKILAQMRASKQRIKQWIKNTPGLSFRRLTDEQGDSGPFLILTLSGEKQALQAVRVMREQGLHNVHRLADYGLHIYSNIPSLVKKIPLSPAGNPWRLEANRRSVYNYQAGACPQSDELFARSILLPIPSRLTRKQEQAAAQIIRKAAGSLDARYKTNC